MILKPILETCFTNCKKVTFKDITGLYGAEDNPFGWGNTLNPGGLTPADIYGAKIIFLDNDGDEIFTVHTKTGSLTINEYPDEAESIMDLGEYDFELDDGIYTINYSMTAVDTDNDSITTYTDKIFISCGVESCLEDMLMKAVKSNSDKDWATYNNTNNLFVGMQAQFLCNDFNNALKTLATIQKICLYNGCGCGCN